MLTLVRFKERDIHPLISWIENEKSLMQWGGPTFQFPLTVDQITQYMNAPDRHVFKVYDSSSEETVGHLSIGRINSSNKEGRIGKVLVHPKTRGSGIGQEMMKLITNYAFQELNLTRVMLGVFDFNIPAIRCYEKVGFQKDRLLKNHRSINGEKWSLYEMSLSKEQWDNRCLEAQLFLR